MPSQLSAPGVEQARARKTLCLSGRAACRGEPLLQLRAKANPDYPWSAMTVSVAQIVDLLALVYHEGRYVQILDQLESPSRYARLSRLPRDPYAAWRALSSVRTKAAQFKAHSHAAKAFAKAFRLELDDLARLYSNPIWDGRRVGGAKWAVVSSQLRDLIRAINSGADADASRLYQDLMRLEHNTGTVGQKLHRLNEGRREANRIAPR